MDKDAIFRSLLRVVVFLTAISTWAAPAIRGSFTVCQPDGTLLTIEQFGDEHHHWTSTSDGTLVVNKGGAYYVAAIDDAGCLSATSILAHEAPERGSKEQQQIAVQASRKALFHQRGDEMLTRAMTISSLQAVICHTKALRVYSPSWLPFRTALSPSTNPFRPLNSILMVKNRQTWAIRTITTS